MSILKTNMIFMGVVNLFKPTNMVLQREFET